MDARASSGDTLADFTPDWICLRVDISEFRLSSSDGSLNSDMMILFAIDTNVEVGVGAGRRRMNGGKGSSTSSKVKVHGSIMYSLVVGMVGR